MQITPTPPEPAARPTPGAPTRPSEGGFAQLLGQRQAAPTAPTAPTDPTAAPEDTPPATPPHATVDGRGARVRATPRDAAPRGTATARHADAKAPADTSGDEVDAAQRKTDAAPATPDPALSQWLAGLHMPPPDSTPAAGNGAARAGSGKSDTADLTASGQAAAGSRDADLRAALRDDTRRDERVDSAADRARAATTATADTRRESFAAEAAAAFGQRGATSDAAQPATRHEVDASAVVAQAAAPAAAGRSDVVPTTVDVRMSTPLESPEFAQAFGVQVSVLAHDGVQQAELHLNPAEMGPVSVQIVLDGTQARVDFGADAAGTRHAIEQSLPELAAALRDAGFTLSGGGVSQHAAGGEGQGARDETDARRPSARPAVDAAAAAPRRPWRGTLSASGVDLYA